MPRAATRVLAALALALFALPVAAWGPLGHRLVAALARDELDPAAQAEITTLLAGEPDPTLAGVATWADELRANDPDASSRPRAWHYVNLGETGCTYDAARDCQDGDCVVGAIGAQSRDPRRPFAPALRAAAMR